ncbi:MAG: TerB family tellurite resistance protein [Burkholderiaceae bacterium]|nr:TerB family tellurite resistance protein [Burkholderiaceae bacterium]
MLKSILEFFDQRIGNAAPADASSIQRATAALLAEMVRIDRDVTLEEQAIAHRAIREKFGLSQAEAAELLELADAEVRDATDYYQFTSLINRDFTQEQKERVIELLWQVAYADDELSAHELHLMRKVAGLLHIPDSVYIAAKVRAKEQAAGGG